jgi:cobalamin biosynthesis Mg chelatase CobN
METPTDNTSTDNTSTDNTSTDNTSTDNTSTDNTSTDNTSTDNTSTDNTSTDNRNQELDTIENKSDNAIKLVIIPMMAAITSRVPFSIAYMVIIVILLLILGFLYITDVKYPDDPRSSQLFI